MSASTRWLAGVAAVIALVVVAAVAVTALAGEQREFAEGTPERTVQRYINAIVNDDSEAARREMSPELAARCEQFTKGMLGGPDQRNVRATLEETVQRTGGVQVRVQLTQTYGDGGPFNSGESTQRISFDLAQIDGAWRLTEAPWPFGCYIGRAEPVVPGVTAGAATATRTAIPTAAPVATASATPAATATAMATAR